MGALQDRFAADLKAAMKARDQLRVDTIRSALSGFTYKRTEAGVDLSDADEMEVVRRQVKQRTDAAAEFEKGGRPELAEKETREREILMAYLPANKSPEEIRTMVRAFIAELPEGKREKGPVMKVAMSSLRGVADGRLVQQIVSEELGGP
ncbi:MAG: GatB/YqeY domain-containing protein [Candidatus Eremiobacteraeota bacterium]|nr:GatB/YqeY domain-containing protein [Candidatus Eremiobacteraeota bacterium]